VAALAGFLTLILMAVFVVAVVALFVRLPKVGLSSRKRALWTMAGCVIAFLILVALVPAESQPPADKPATPKPGAPAQPPPKVEDGKAALQRQSDELWGKIEATLQPCDAYVQAAGEAVSASGSGAGSTADAYEAATTAKRACDLVVSDMFEVKPPAAARGEVKDAFDDAISTCRDTATVKSMTMQSLAKYLDGDRRPSVEVEIKERMADSKTQAMRCVLSYLKASEKGGVTMKSLREAEAKAKAEQGDRRTTP